MLPWALWVCWRKTAARTAVNVEVLAKRAIRIKVRFVENLQNFPKKQYWFRNKYRTRWYFLNFLTVWRIMNILNIHNFQFFWSVLEIKGDFLRIFRFFRKIFLRQHWTYWICCHCDVHSHFNEVLQPLGETRPTKYPGQRYGTPHPGIYTEHRYKYLNKGTTNRIRVKKIPKTGVKNRMPTKNTQNCI